MATAQPQRRLFTPEEYLTLERASEHKSEYLEGEIYAMAGGSPEHNTITANLTIRIGMQLLGRSCQVFTSDMKVRSSTLSLFAYPDLSIVCGKPQYHDAHRDVLTNPTVIFEVLSDSTEAYDRVQKFANYQINESLIDYLLVAQKEPHIDHFARQGEDQWLLTSYRGLDARVYIASIDCTLRLSEVYDRVEFPPKPPLPFLKP